MKFNEHQTNLWVAMLESIGKYRKGELCYSELINGLEGAYQVGEFKEYDIIEKWFDLWIPLEILSATKGDNTTIGDANKYLLAMEIFLKSKTDLLIQEDEEY
jgi:hypothetical protein